jgi:thymidylate synthase (FAD)
MFTKLIDTMGDDLAVANAARVSFAKESKWDVLGRKEEYDDDGNVCESAPIKRLSEQDRRLLKYLAQNDHWSPFSHCYLKFHIKAPIFVARQLQKHTVGLAWNEVSRRYVDSEPEFYMPETWRPKAANKKQGSGEGEVELDDNDPLWVLQTVTACRNLYTYLLDVGVCPEQARMMLPQNMYTEWIWSGSLYAFLRVCKLRLDGHAQKETGDVVMGIAAALKNKFPTSWEVFNGTS